jgi:hypothetical protein
MCCGAKPLPRNSGQSQQRTFAAARVQAAPAQPSTVTFEYVGPSGLTVVSPTTGRRYRFEGPGAQLTVDSRDQAMLLYVPNLRPVRFGRAG